MERIEGLWWLASHPARTNPGTLVLARDDRLVLHLEGELPILELDSTPQAQSPVHGQSHGGEAYTLLDWFSTEPLGRGSRASMEVHANSVLRGIHSPSDDEIQLELLQLNADGLKPWSSPRPTSPRDFVIDLPHGVLTIVTPTWPTLTAAGSYTNDTTTFRFQPSSPLTLAQVGQKVINPLRYYVTFATGARCPAMTTLVQPLHQGSSPSPMFEHIYVTEPPPPGRLNPLGILLPISGRAIDTPALIARWFNLYRDHAQALHLFFADTFRPHPYLETRYLLMVQTAELYHRVAHPPSPEAKQEAKRLRESVLDNASAADKRRLEGKLNNLHEPSLRLRLEELATRAAAIFPELNAKEIAGTAAATRNHLTHYNKPDNPTVVAGGHELFSLLVQLQATVTACLIQDLGIVDSDAKELLENTRLARYLRLFGSTQ
jgi:hypothetical protein